MKAVLDAKAFWTALKKANTATSKLKCNIPTRQVCVSIRDGICRLTGTDHVSWLVAELPAQGEDFSFLFADTNKMLRVCKYFSGELTLELTVIEPPFRAREWKLSLSCGERSAEFGVYEDLGMHELPEKEAEAETYRFHAPSLLARVERVRYAASKTDTRLGPERRALSG